MWTAYFKVGEKVLIEGRSAIIKEIYANYIVVCWSNDSRSRIEIHDAHRIGSQY